MGGQLAHQMVGLLPDALAEKVMQKAGIDRLNAFYLAIDIVRRGGTISLIGVYGGMADPLPMLTLFDKQIPLRMGQANVKRWSTTSCPCSRTATRSASTASPRTACRSTRRPTPPPVPAEAGRRRQGPAPAVSGSRSAGAKS